MRSIHAAILALAIGASGQEAVQPETIYWPGDEWEVSTPKAVGLDAKKLEATAKFVLSRNSTSFLVLRGGRIVLEKYGNGGGVNVKRRIASATKSMTAILVGMALDAGKFEGLDQPVAHFLPGWKDTPKEKITLLHLLTMTSGLNPKGFARMRPEGDQFEANGKMKRASAPGAKWQYNTPAYHMTFRWLEKATGVSLPEWTNDKLLAPLGMKHTLWTSQDRGDVTNYFNLACSARDMARFGVFVLRKGKWRDKQLVSAAFFNAATSPSQELNPAYGYLFWLNAKKGHSAVGRKIDYRFPGVPRDAIACLGAKGQQILAIPSQDLVLVRQGDSPQDRSFTARYARMVLAAIDGGGFKDEPIPPARPRATPRGFARLDTDGDGKLSAEEFAKSVLASWHPDLFKKLDTDKDGFLSTTEATRFAQRRR